MFIAHQLSSCCCSVLWKSCWWRWFSQKGKQLSRDLCVFRSVLKYPHRVLADKRSRETGGLSDSPMSSLVHSLFPPFPKWKSCSTLFLGQSDTQKGQTGRSEEGKYWRLVIRNVGDNSFCRLLHLFFSSQTLLSFCCVLKLGRSLNFCKPTWRSRIPVYRILLGDLVYINSFFYW